MSSSVRSEPRPAALTDVPLFRLYLSYHFWPFSSFLGTNQLISSSFLLSDPIHPLFCFHDGFTSCLIIAFHFCRLGFHLISFPVCYCPKRPEFLILFPFISPQVFQCLLLLFKFPQLQPVAWFLPEVLTTTCLILKLCGSEELLSLTRSGVEGSRRIWPIVVVVSLSFRRV